MAAHPFVRAALIGLDGFTALTAVGGGLALASGLEGDRFPVQLLRGTPFSSYVVPGLILAGVVGGSATAATVLTLRSPRLGGPASTCAGVVLIGWIAGEVLILRSPEARSWVEAGYVGIGLLMAGLGLVAARAERPVLLDTRHGSASFRPGAPPEGSSAEAADATQRRAWCSVRPVRAAAAP